MSRPRFLFYLALTLAVACFGSALCLSPACAQTSLDELLTPYLARYDLPAVAAAVVQDGRVVAPLGHQKVGSTDQAFLAGPNGDNPPTLGPAGLAHMSVLDFAAWAGWNAGQGKRGPALVRPETLRKLHTPVIAMVLQKQAQPGTPSQGKYALGWGEVTVPWAPAPLIYHGGSNGLNLAHIWLAPQQDFGLVLVTNIGGHQADQALSTLAPELYQKFAPPSAAKP